MSRKKRNYFFQPSTGNKRFLDNDKPDQETFQNLLDSATFPTEVSDKAKETEAGLVKITTDVKVNTRVGSDSAGISPSGFPTFIKPSQLPNFFSVSPNKIRITLVARTPSSPGYAEAPNILDYEFDLPSDTDDILWLVEFTPSADDAFVKAILNLDMTPAVPGQYFTEEDTALPKNGSLTERLKTWLLKSNANAETLMEVIQELVNVYDRVTVVEGKTLKSLYNFAPSDCLNSVVLSGEALNPDGNEHQPRLYFVGNRVQLHGTILLPTAIANDTAILKIPRAYLPSLAIGNIPSFADRQYISVFGDLPARIAVEMGNVGGGVSPNDYGALIFKDCRVAAGTGIGAPATVGGGAYVALNLDGIGWDL